VDTQPTGIALCFDLPAGGAYNGEDPKAVMRALRAGFLEHAPVPESVIRRQDALDADQALSLVEEFLNGLEKTE
jgi:hypothetical protein